MESAGVYPVRMRPQAPKIPSMSSTITVPASLIGCAPMKRRTLLQLAAGAAAVLPFERIRLLAQPRELTPEAITTLREIAPTVLPSLGDKKIGDIVDKFVEWTKGYREGVPLAHGYGHPRLQKTGPSPVPRYMTQLADLDAASRKTGGWRAMETDARRAALDEAFTK